MPLKLKIDNDGHAVLKDGKPIYLKDDGAEIEFDADHAFKKIGQLTGEATDYRKKMEAATERAELFKDIENPEDARKALQTVKNLDGKKLVDAGEVQKVRDEAIKAVEDRYKPIVEENGSLKNQLYSEKIGGAFSRSKTISDKFAIPADLVQAKFGSRFKIEDNKIVAYTDDGQKVFSQKRPGDLADFDEALEIIVDSYPHKAAILKGTGAQGGGAANSGHGNNGNGQGGKKVYQRAEFDKADPMGRASMAKEVSAGKAEIRDASP